MKLYRYFLKHSGGVVDVLCDEDPNFEYMYGYGHCVVHRGQIGERIGMFWTPAEHIAGTVVWEVEEGETL